MENLSGGWLTSLQLFISYILFLYPLLLCSYPANFPPCFLSNHYFLKMNSPSHTFSILGITFHTLLSQVVLRSHRHVKPTTFGLWQLSLPCLGWTQSKVLNPQCGQRKWVELPAKGLLQMVWLLCRALGAGTEGEEKTSSPYSSRGRWYESCYSNKIFWQHLKMHYRVYHLLFLHRVILIMRL